MAELTQDRIETDTNRLPAALRLWPLFVAIGVLLYLALYLWSETLVRDHAERNRFYKVATAPLVKYDHVILGASHALPFDYADFNARLEQASGTSVMNLANEGAGILPNQLILDYFLAGHDTGNVIFFLDSFAFYSPQWNEDRMDSAMLARAPFDPTLVATLWKYPWARDEILPYASGFTKINNKDRFAPDRTEAELTKFDKTYRPIPQIDTQRITYLYPEAVPPGAFEHYLAAFEALADTAEAHGAEFIAIKPPTPARYRDALPNETAFDAAIAEIVARRGIAYYDFSQALPDEANYYDTDHLNSTGVAAFIEADFADLLREQK